MSHCATKLTEKAEQSRQALRKMEFMLNNSAGYYELDAQGYFVTANNRFLANIELLVGDIEAKGFKNQIPTGALLLVSDQPMISSGVKTRESDNKVTHNYVDTHLEIGIRSLQEIINNCQSVKHLRF